ncbi:MAG TPA: M14 family metallopeptidase [Candidatus Paceibacterota bacterium]
MKKIIIAVIIIVVLGGIGIYYVMKSPSDTLNVTQDQTATSTSTTGTEQNVRGGTGATVIGKSSGGRDIIAYTYGTGTTTKLLFVGGIHGGYEWNTVLVAQALADYLKVTPSVIPSNIQVTVIPVLNPDGLVKVVGTTTGNFTSANVSSSQEVQISGRFNGNTVDLNRNFDCDWQSTGTWQSTSVSGGDSAFSEPESHAIKAYVETQKPTAVIVWYSAAGGVFASSCHNGVSSKTRTIMNTFAKASGYPAHEVFNYYAITGDMTNWLAKENIPAISVLLTTHDSVEWDKNQAGIKALFDYYAK